MEASRNGTTDTSNATGNVSMTTEKDTFLPEITVLLPFIAIVAVIVNMHFFITLCVHRSTRKHFRYIILVSLILTDLSFGCSLLLSFLVRLPKLPDLCIGVDMVTRVLKISSNIHVPIILAERCFNIYMYDEKPRMYPVKPLIMRIAMLWSIVLVTCLPIIICSFEIKYEVACSLLPIRDTRLFVAMKYTSILFLICLILSFVCSFIICVKIFQNLKDPAKVHNCSFVKSCNIQEYRRTHICKTEQVIATIDRTLTDVEPEEHVTSTSEISNPSEHAERKLHKTQETNLSDTPVQQTGPAKHQTYISGISAAGSPEKEEQKDKYRKIHYLKQKRLRDTILVVIFAFVFHSILFLPLHILNCLVGFGIVKDNIENSVWFLCHQLNSWQSVINPFLFILPVKELRDHFICCKKYVSGRNAN